MSPRGERRRESFDTVAELYHAGRPPYPASVVDTVVHALGVVPGTRVLEIGCGTGRFSVELCRAGAELLAVELGPNLARLAREHLAAYPGAHVVTAPFEDWPLPAEPFDGACAATAFHWLDAAAAFDKCAAALRPGGALAIVHAHHVRGGTEAFFSGAQSLYVRYGLSDEPDFEPPETVDVPPLYPELDEHPAFEDVRRPRIDVDTDFDTAAHIAMLRTDSLVLSLEEPARRAFLEEMALLIDRRHGGRVSRAYCYEIVTARRIASPGRAPTPG